jgi:glyoxylase-like metal-dependent hydrolase (beta-lactamase superfamily II)
MRSPATRRALGRGERILPGLWRLRLPLQWPGIPHANAYALTSADGVVLVDTGAYDEEDGLDALEQAFGDAGLRVDDVTLIVCTHAHLDHCGAAPAIVERTGAQLWMHPRHEHRTTGARDLEADLAERTEVARQSGADERGLQAHAERRRAAGPILPGPLEPDHDLVDGVAIATDLGTWQAVETPGHAPSHVSLHLPERRLLIAGDVVLGRVALYFDHGWTPDPVAEQLGSLDRVDYLDARLARAGHGKPFGDLPLRIEAQRAEIRVRLHTLRAMLSQPATAYELGPRIYGDAWTPATVPYFFAKALSYVRHLELRGELERLPGSPQRWVAR